MKVYVVECGCYADSYIDGIYATLEAAKRANPVPVERGSRDKIRDGGWQMVGESLEEDAWWDNGYDWGYAATIREYEVLGSTDEREAA